MKRYLSRVAVVCALLLTSFAVSSPASAFGELNADVDVSPTANVSNKGTSVQWTVYFNCPKGSVYDVEALIASLDEFGDPIAFARYSGGGRCTGRSQRANLRLTGTSVIEPTTRSAAQVVISGDNFFAGWASGPDNCCEDDGPRIIIV